MFLRVFSGLGHSMFQISNLIRRKIQIKQMKNFSNKMEQKEFISIPVETKISGTKTTHDFQAETRELLNIVSKSLYTEKEVFIRELLSNASDALEKARYKQASGEKLIQSKKKLQINIYTDKTNNTITIQDYGIGMSKEELIKNIGTIARSGSKEFINAIQDSETGGQKLDSIIGQFGVGFYSTFMVSDKVEVFSQSMKGDQGYYWVSDGSGSYQIAEAENIERGCKIIIYLKSDCQEFSDKFRVEAIIKKYSSYLQFPISLNDSIISNMGALWSKTPNNVTDEQHKEFYQLISNTYDTPHYVYHSHFENVKYNIQCLLYFPGSHSEKAGFGRLDPGVNVYSRKVLIKPKAKEILPDWLRFVKGVVDSENIPLHISRENMQDSKLIQEINETLMLKIVEFLKRQNKKDSKKFKEFYKNFNPFFKEGICTDYKNRRKIAYLLRYESTKNEKDELTSIDDYIERMKGDQKDIYFLVSPNRETALSSPYLEHLKEKDIEVLLGYAQIDQFVFENLLTYRQKDLVSVEKSKVEAEVKRDEEALTLEESEQLCKWIQKQMPDKISECGITWRLKKHPVILIDHESQAVRSYIRALNEDVGLSAQKMHINPTHQVIRGLYKFHKKNKKVSKLLVKQLVNNAYISAGLMEDSREMLTNINEILILLVQQVGEISEIEEIEELN